VYLTRLVKRFVKCEGEFWWSVGARLRLVYCYLRALFTVRVAFFFLIDFHRDLGILVCIPVGCWSCVGGFWALGWGQ